MHANTKTTVGAMKKSLALVAPAVATGSYGGDLLKSVRIGYGRVWATDAVAMIDAPMPGADFAPVLVSMRDLKSALAALKTADDVELDAVDGAVVLRSRLGETTFEHVDDTDWPGDDLFADDAATSTVVPADPVALAAALQDVATARSGDESRPNLQAVDVRAADGRIDVMATDSYRLALATLDGDADEPVDSLAPIGAYVKTLQRVDRFESTGRADANRLMDAHLVTMHDDVTGMRVRVRAARPVQRLDYRKLIPDAWETSFDLPADFADVVGYVKKTADAKRPDPIRLVVDVDEFAVQATGRSAHSKTWDVAPCAYAPHTIGADAGFLLDGLAFVGDGASLSTISPLRPLFLQTTGRAYLQMPIRLPDSRA